MELGFLGLVKSIHYISSYLCWQSVQIYQTNFMNEKT